ncbi:protein phosphatase CheZ [Pseudomarimonas salicorniae]|uniref:Protein phosphatase CheZ n=1 Tax=Pseudomarimonas salicorniae TaxID=2933270 RepID=A0ABT0GKQ9_9GAMM|nr:protein phosphatase CheZ [Lysobacter sp. CAU 1642]MCK7595132.1 protein phosphatase CheZ [Lysobacter sp. CAU 1642]
MSNAGGREELIARLHAALEALEANDEQGFKAAINAIAELRTSPVIQALARLARELGETLGSLNVADPLFAELPDASARLQHVVKMTEDATHTTLDLVEKSRELLDSIPPEAGGEALAAVRKNLSEVALAQSYQDLTGQIIKRVVGVVDRVYDTVAAFGIDVRAEQRNDTGLAGPAVKGVDSHGVSQDDADDLLSQLDL